jgi:hypothetical protein
MPLSACRPLSLPVFFFPNYTMHDRPPQRPHTHLSHANPTLGASSKTVPTNPPQAPRCRREHRLPLKAQTPLNPNKFALTRSQTQELRCYRGFNHQGRGPIASPLSPCQYYLLIHSSRRPKTSTDLFFPFPLSYPHSQSWFHFSLS